MAEQLLDTNPQLRGTVTDLGSAMIHTATERLARFADRAEACQADATRVPFGDETFDDGQVVRFVPRRQGMPRTEQGGGGGND